MASTDVVREEKGVVFTSFREGDVGVCAEGLARGSSSLVWASSSIEVKGVPKEKAGGGDVLEEVLRGAERPA